MAHKAEVLRQLKDAQAVYDRNATTLEQMEGQFDSATRSNRAMILKRQQEVDAQIESLTLALTRIKDEEASTAAALTDAIDQRQREERNFWFRRFHTSLAIAHGAGFAAVVSHLFDPAVTAATAAAAFAPMGAFALGMVLAGMIPVALYRDAARTAWALAGVSAFLFCLALAVSLIAVWGKAEFKPLMLGPPPAERSEAVLQQGNHPADKGEQK